MPALLDRQTALGRCVAITVVVAIVVLGGTEALGPQVAEAGGPPQCRSPIPGDNTAPPKTIRAVAAGADNAVYGPSVSEEGRHVAYLAGPRLGDHHAFVRDIETGQSSLVSVTPDDDPATTNSVSMSREGDVFAFNSGGNVYVNSAGTTELLPRARNEPAISAGGRYVATAYWDWSTASHTIAVVDTFDPSVVHAVAGFDGSPPNAWSTRVSVSADGRYIAFESYASNLVPDDTNRNYDVFVYDVIADTATRLSQSSTGVGGNGDSVAPSISADGRYVAFRSQASNLVPGDTNGRDDVFVYELGSSTITSPSLVPRASSVGPVLGRPSISADGRYVAFESLAPNLVPGDTNGKTDVFVHDLAARTTTRVSVTATGAQSDGDSWGASISADGRWVAFSSRATDLIGTGQDTNEEADIFLRGPLGFDSADLPPCIPDRFDRDDPVLTPPESRPDNDTIERATHLGLPGGEPELAWQPVSRPGLEQWELRPASMPEGLDAEPLNFHTRADEDWFTVTAVPEAIPAQCAPVIKVDAPHAVFVSIMMQNPLTGELGEVASSRPSGGPATASGFRIGEGEVVIRFQRADPQAATFELITYDPTITYSDVPTNPFPGACL